MSDCEIHYSDDEGRTADELMADAIADWNRRAAT